VCHGRTNIKLFADDAKLYSEIDFNDCSLSLQTSLDYNLATWAFSWQLSINVDKYCVLSTVINKRTSISGSNKYYWNGILLTNNVYVLDLGITISADLLHNAYVNNIVARALQRSSTSFRGFASRNLQLMREACVTHIRHILEYNSILWSPNLVYLIDSIESAQCKFTKRINSLASVPYSNRLNLLNLQPLELRRLHLDLTNFYKIINGLSPLTATDYFIIYSPITSIRSNTASLLRPLHASSKLSSFFLYKCRCLESSSI